MTDAVAAALGAVLVAALNELRAQLRARQADADRREALQRRLQGCDRVGCSPGGRGHGGDGCADEEPE